MIGSVQEANAHTSATYASGAIRHQLAELFGKNRRNIDDTVAKMNL